MSLNAFDDALDEQEPVSIPVTQTPQAPNPYDAAIDRMERADGLRMRQSVIPSVEQSPDAAAEVRRLSRQLGLAPDAVARDLAGARKRAAAAKPYEQILQQTPLTAEWIAKPENAAIAHDTLESVGMLEWLLTAPRRAWDRGWAQVEMGQLSHAGLFRGLSQAERERLERLRLSMNQGGALGTGESWFRSAIVGAAQQLPITFGALVAGAKYGIPAGATTGTAAALLGQAGPQLLTPEEVVTVPGAFIGGLTAGMGVGATEFGFQIESGLAFDEYSQMRDEVGQPMDPDVAKAAAFAAGALNGGLEAVGLGLLLRQIPGLQALTKPLTRGAIREALKNPSIRTALYEAITSYGGTITGETAIEVAQRSITILAGELGKVADGSQIPLRAPSDVANDLKDEAIGALSAFALLSLPGPSLQLRADVQEAKRAAQNVAFFQALGEATANTPALERAPEAVRELMQSAAEQGGIPTVYAPVETWVEYWQSKGIDPSEMAEVVTGRAGALEEAATTGADLAIPTSRYASNLAGGKHNTFLAQELRLAPDAMNAREAKAFQQEQESIAAEQQTQERELTSRERIRAQLTQQLEAAAVPRATAEAYAGLVEAGLGTMAEAAGLDPFQVFERYGLEIERGVEGETKAAGGPPETTGPEAEGVAAAAPENVPLEPASERSEFGQGLIDVGDDLRAGRQGIESGAVSGDALTDEGNYQPVAGQAQIDRAASDAKLLADLFEGEALGPKKDRLLRAPSLSAVVAKMRAARDKNPEVFGAIVRSIPVDVVNNLFGSQRAAEEALRDDPMFQDGAAVDAELSIPLTIDASDAVPFFLDQVARRAAEVGFIPTRPRRKASKAGTALGTDESRSFSQRRRASITIGRDRKISIKLFETANLSSFLHETGHFFLEVVGDLVEQLPADGRTAEQERLDGDYQALLAALGVESRGQIRTEQHETFARMFEAYLFEGRAPSIELRSIFSKFRAWLLGVYRQIRALNAPLTAEVRGLFDRMLASEVAIQRAAQSGRYDPAFLTAEDAGMSPERFEVYRKAVEDASLAAREDLDRKLAAEVERERQREWKARRAEIRAEVAAEVHQAPVYRALAAMRRGTAPDGSPLVEGVETPPLRLSRAILVERFGADRLKSLPPLTYAREGGVDPDALGERFGFGSGDELLTAIATAMPMDRAIEAATDARMLAEHGSILLDGTLPAEADASMSNDVREHVIRAELRALHALQRQSAAAVAQAEREGKAALAGEKAERAYERQWLEAEARLRIAIAEGRKQVEIDRLEKAVQQLEAKARGGAVELRSLSRGIPDQQQIRDAAAARIAATRIIDLEPARFWSASRQQRQKALERASRQDFAGAVQAMTQELINLALYREAQRVRDRVDADARYARALAKPAAQARLGLAGGPYLDQVLGLLDRFEFARVSQTVLRRRANVRDFVAGLEADGRPVDLPEDVLDDSRRVNYVLLTVEHFEGVIDGLKQIVHLSQTKNRLLKEREARTLAQVADRLSTSIRDHARGRARPVRRDRAPSGERVRTVGDFFAGHRKLASLLREMDGFEDGGPMVSEIMFRLNEAGARESQMMADATQRFAELVERAFPGSQKRTLYTRIHIPAVGRAMSRMERIGVALNWGNEGNRDRLRTYERWTDAQVQAILDTLTPAEIQFVQGIFDFFESFRPEIGAKQKRVTGLEPSWVEAVPIRAAGGEIRGGYFPLKYDDRLSAKQIAALDLEAANLAKQAAYNHATTKRGHTKERAAKNKAPVRLDFGVMFEHVGQVIHDLTHHEALIDVGRILGHPDVSAAILETQGDLVYKQIRNAVRDVAFGDVPATSGFERALNHVRAGATVAGLGWNLTTSFLQPIGLTNSMVRIGPKWVAVGLTRWLRSPRSMVDTPAWIEERSEFMRARARSFNREISEIRNKVQASDFGSDSRVGGTAARAVGWMEDTVATVTGDRVTRQGIADSYFWMIQQMQRVADIPTWLGAYEKAMASGETEARAVKLADQAVLDSQGGGQIKDLSQVQRGGPMMKLWTNFYSFFNVLYNQAAESRRRTNFRQPSEIGRLASDYLMLFIVPATLGYLVRAALRPGDDLDEDEILTDLAWENASYVAGTMLGLREVSGALTGAFGYEGPAGARAFAGLARLGQQVKQGEPDAAFWRALNDVGGVILHYPAGQAKRTIEGIAALAEGKTKNPLAVVTGPPRE